MTLFLNVLSHFQESVEAEKTRFIAQFLPFVHCVKLDGVKACYEAFDPAVSALWLCIVFAVYCLVWSIIGNNCSKVDQLWSITPVVYAWLIYAWPSSHHAGHNIRLLVSTLLITLWGVRLTYNFWRRGGYGNFFTHEEDYRWPILRKWFNNPFVFFIFNVIFIASYQNLLLYLIAMPLCTVSKGTMHMSGLDWLCALIIVLLIVVESIADQQHWNFHARKHSVPPAKRSKHADNDIREGFYQSGLWYYSRHPNYFCEQMIWVMIYCFSIVHVDNMNQILNVWVIGAALLIILFQASMAFGESITKSKYVDYQEYCARTSMCIPFFPKPRMIAKKVV